MVHSRSVLTTMIKEISIPLGRVPQDIGLADHPSTLPKVLHPCINHLAKQILSRYSKFHSKNSLLKWTSSLMDIGSDLLPTTQQECGVARAELGFSYLD